MLFFILSIVALNMRGERESSEPTEAVDNTLKPEYIGLGWPIVMGLITPFIMTSIIMTVKTAVKKHSMNSSLFSMLGQFIFMTICTAVAFIYWSFIGWKGYQP